MIKNGVGISKYTRTKLDTFRTIIRAHIAISNAVIQKNKYYDQSYWYFDITAGPGHYEDIDGSPLVFIQEAVKHPEMQFNIVLIEIERDNFNKLIFAIDPYREYKNINLYVENGDHKDILKEYYGIGAKKIGLIYCDPSGNCPSFDLLRETSIVRTFTSLDFLVYMSATNVKRVANSPDCKEKRKLSEFVSTINKKWWQWKEPIGQHQWTFLFGSNYQFNEFKSIKFHSSESKMGKEVFRKLSNTNGELGGGYND